MKKPNHRQMLTRMMYYWYERPNSDYYFELHELYMLLIDIMEKLGIIRYDRQAFDKVFA
jgi:hypothetical protein